MTLFYRCDYCGLEFEWEKQFNMYQAPFCSHCGDENIKVIQKDLSKRDVFGYNEIPMKDAYIFRKK